MSRLIVLLALALAPLLAAAHEGHDAPGHDAGASKAAAKADGAIIAIAQAPSRCPGGDHEFCCCHDATCTPSFQPAAVDAPRVHRPMRPSGLDQLSHGSYEAPRAAAPPRYSPRGPPEHS